MPIGGGSHFQGPILGSTAAGGGAFQNIDIGAISRMSSKYKVWFEDFKYAIAAVAAGTNFALEGWTVTPVGAVAANTIGVTDAQLGLLINAGTATQTGYTIEHKSAYMDPTTATAAPIIPPHDVFGPMTSTATLMANRETIWQSRMGFSQAVSGAGSWSNGTGMSCLFGIFVSDTSTLNPAGLGAGGDYTMGNGGGCGFLIHPNGRLWAVASRAGGTGAAAKLVKTLPDVTSATTPGSSDFYEFGFRITHGPTPSGTTVATAGYAEWFLNGQRVAKSTEGTWVRSSDYATSISTPELPFNSTQAYATCYTVLNSDANTAADVVVDYVFTAMSRPGDTRLINL